MSNQYICTWNKLLLQQFQNFQPNIQLSISEFQTIFHNHGLNDFNKYPGKITCSWKNASAENAAHAKTYNLWHYHIGYPNYTLSICGKYHTSDMVLHFQWDRSNVPNTIYLADIYDHRKSDGNFYLPPVSYLEK